MKHTREIEQAKRLADEAAELIYNLEAMKDDRAVFVVFYASPARLNLLMAKAQRRHWRRYNTYVARQRARYARMFNTVPIWVRWWDELTQAQKRQARVLFSNMGMKGNVYLLGARNNDRGDVIGRRRIDT